MGLRLHQSPLARLACRPTGSMLRIKLIICLYALRA